MSEKMDYYIKLGIAIRIPMAFNRFCDDQIHDLIENVPPKYSDQTEEEQKINLLFVVQNKAGDILASLEPNGMYECLNQEFKPIFNKIVEDLHYAAHKAKKAQEELHRRMTEEFEKKFERKIL